MSRLHAANVKGCLTLNTLLYEHDLKLCRKMLETAAEQKVDHRNRAHESQPEPVDEIAFRRQSGFNRILPQNGWTSLTPS